MKFTTSVELPHFPFEIEPQSRLLFLGSCFAEEIGGKFTEHLFSSLCNPLGTIYNPLSIAQILSLALESKMPDQSCYFFAKDRWICWLGNTTFEHTDRVVLEAKVRDTLNRLGDWLKQTDFLFITLGTNHYYQTRDTNIVVTNCHKVDGKQFEERVADAEVLFQKTEPIYQTILKNFQNIKVLFTVSPYRYLKYGLHGNRLAKAALFTYIEHLCSIYPNQAFYFPSYEIMEDELRDYRYYASDMVHPSEQAIEYIWEKCSESLLSLSARHFAQDAEALERLRNHRPLSSNQSNWLALQEQYQSKVEEFRNKYPFANIHPYKENVATTS